MKINSIRLKFRAFLLIWNILFLAFDHKKKTSRFWSKKCWFFEKLMMKQTKESKPGNAFGKKILRARGKRKLVNKIWANEIFDNASPSHFHYNFFQLLIEISFEKICLLQTFPFILNKNLIKLFTKPQIKTAYSFSQNLDYKKTVLK